MTGIEVGVFYRIVGERPEAAEDFYTLGSHLDLGWIVATRRMSEALGSRYIFLLPKRVGVSMVSGVIQQGWEHALGQSLPISDEARESFRGLLETLCHNEKILSEEEQRVNLDASLSAIVTHYERWLITGPTRRGILIELRSDSAMGDERSQYLLDTHNLIWRHLRQTFTNAIASDQSQQELYSMFERYYPLLEKYSDHLSRNQAYNGG